MLLLYFICEGLLLVLLLLQRYVSRWRTKRQLQKRLDRATSYLEWRILTKAVNFGKKNGNLLDIEIDVALAELEALEARKKIKAADLEKYVEKIRSTVLTERKLSERDKEKIDLFQEKLAEKIRRFALEQSDEALERTRRELLRIREIHGFSAFSMSGGGILAKVHIGVLKSLWEQKLLPQIIAGSSAGAILAAMICLTENETFETFFANDFFRDILEDNDERATVLWRIRRKVERLFSKGTFLDSEHLQKRVRECLGELTFQEALEKTGRILNITVSTTGGVGPFVLNYKNAPNVYIWSAVVASCSIPGIFTPHKILERCPEGPDTFWLDGEFFFIDGSVGLDVPYKQLTEQFNVKYNIVCQVNPHVYPFMKHKERLSVFTSLYARITLFLGRSFLAKKFRMFGHINTILSQRYSGDTTILPEIPLDYLVQPLSSIKQNKMTDYLARGERAVWPHIEDIHRQRKIELEIEACLVRLEELQPRAGSSGDSPAYTFTLDPKKLAEWELALSETEISDTGESGKLSLNTSREW